MTATTGLMVSVIYYSQFALSVILILIKVLMTMIVRRMDVTTTDFLEF